MTKNTSMFSQIIRLIPSDAFSRIVRDHDEELEKAFWERREGNFIKDWKTLINPSPS